MSNQTDRGRKGKSPEYGEHTVEVSSTKSVRLSKRPGARLRVTRTSVSRGGQLVEFNCS